MAYSPLAPTPEAIVKATKNSTSRGSERSAMVPANMTRKSDGIGSGMPTSSMITTRRMAPKLCLATEVSMTSFLPGRQDSSPYPLLSRWKTGSGPRSALRATVQPPRTAARRTASGPYQQEYRDRQHSHQPEDAPQRDQEPQERDQRSHEPSQGQPSRHHARTDHHNRRGGYEHRHARKAETVHPSGERQGEEAKLGVGREVLEARECRRVDDLDRRPRQNQCYEHQPPGQRHGRDTPAFSLGAAQHAVERP